MLRPHLSVPAIALLLLPAACGDDNGDRSEGAERLQVTMRTFAFSPGRIEVEPGTTVVWTNADDFAHSVVDDGGAFTSPEVAESADFSFTYADRGEFPYHCGIHNSMTGTVIVT